MGSSLLRSSALSAAVAILTCTSPARADEPSEQPPPVTPTPASPSADSAGADAPHAHEASPTEAASPTPSTSPRPMPDYDGRGPAPSTAGDVALWVPRLALSPAYFTSEYLIRRPMGALITAAEKNQWAAALVATFTFGPDNDIGVVPIALVDFGLRPSVGVFAFWNNAFRRGNDIKAHFATFGPDFLAGTFADRISLDGKKSTLDLRFEGVHRPDLVFYGIGPRTVESARSRYGIDRFDAGPVFNTTWWRGSRLTIAAGIRDVHFRDDACCENPSIPVAVAAGAFPPPPGFASGYTIGYQRLELTVDTREPHPAPQNGIRLAMQGEQGFDLTRSRSNWIRYGASFGGFLDLKDSGRIVSLNVEAQFADPITGSEPIPFTEQVRLGGSEAMRGFLPGRLVDRSAAIATLKYRWPIWVFLDGSMQVATGNVFGKQLEGFDPKLLRLSAAVGLETVGTPDNTLEFLLGFATETFDSGAKVDSFRFVIGTNKGF